MSRNHLPAMENHIKTVHSKLTRTPSSLLRSPTIKSGIDSFSDLVEAKSAEEKEKQQYSKTTKWPKRGMGSDVMLHRKPPFRFQLLLPLLVMIVVPCLWYNIRGIQNPDLNNSDSDAAFVRGIWFDSFSALVFVTAVVISLKIAFPDLRVGIRLPSMRLVKGSSLGQSWGCLAVSWVKPLTSFAISHRRRIKGNPSVTWTIGSKPKSEIRTKIGREGVEVYSNGDVYEGEFHQGKCSGSGVYYYYVNGRYEGDWVDGKYDGYGVETWARGSRYRGQYRQGSRHGYGVYRFYTGDMYAGEWSNGQSHGCGVQTCEDGSRYVGEFKWGVKHGLGYYHFRNGDTYAGEYFADKMHGFGVYRFANEHRYEGAWHEGRKQGLGMYTFRNGETQSGYWHFGVLQTPSTLNSGVTKGVNHAKVLHAVQEARRAAEKAFEVPRVDDRVNKSVAAANKAATAARVAAVKAVQKRMHGDFSPVEV